MDEAWELGATNVTEHRQLPKMFCSFVTGKYSSSVQLMDSLEPNLMSFMEKLVSEAVWACF